MSADVVGVGMVTSVGLDAPSSAAAIRAGISGARGTSVRDDEYGKAPLALLSDEELTPLGPLEEAGLAPMHQRMLGLGAGALAEAAGEGTVPVPLLLALPEPRSGMADSACASFIGQLAGVAGARIDTTASRVFRQGGAGVLHALREGLSMLASRQWKSVIVGGIDSMCDLRRLSRLRGEGRSKAGSSMDAFTPGEGAAFLRLVANEPSSAIARIVAVGLGEEPGHRYSEEAYRGDGLAQAFQATFAALPASYPKIRCVYAGLNGENLPSKEWGVACLRSSVRFEDAFAVEHPAECVGDAGAALGAVMLVCAAIGLERGYRQSPCLVWSTSDGEARGAALLEAVS